MPENQTKYFGIQMPFKNETILSSFQTLEKKVVEIPTQIVLVFRCYYKMDYFVLFSSNLARIGPFEISSSNVHELCFIVYINKKIMVFVVHSQKQVLFI